jgi:hypothetical protein
MTLRNAGLALAVLAVSAVSAAGADAELRWKFRKDKPYHYVLTQGMEMSMKVQNNDVKTKMSQVSEMTWKINTVKPDGSAEMTQVIDRIQIKVEGPGGNFEIDSKRKDDGAQAGPAASINSMVQGIVGVPVDMVMSARGELTSIKIPEKFMEAMKTAGPGGQAFAGAFSEKGMKQAYEQSSMPLPEKAVSVGTTWVQKRTFETPGLGNMDVDTTYTDKGELPGDANIRKIDAVVTVKFNTPENAQVSVRVASQDNAAKFLFNTASGHLSRSEIKQNMKMEISAGGQTFTQDLMQTVSMSLAGESAAK